MSVLSDFDVWVLNNFIFCRWDLILEFQLMGFFGYSQERIDFGNKGLC